MGAFTIYFFVLTGIYLVYYCAIILMDLFGKKGKTEAAGMETIAVAEGSDDDDEQYQVVTEGENGEFTISRPVAEENDDDYKPQVTDEEEPTDNLEEEEGTGETEEYADADNEVPEDFAYTREGAAIDGDEEFDQMFEECKAAAEEAATPIRPSYQFGYDSATARVALNQPMNQKSKILRSVVTIS